MELLIILYYTIRVLTTYIVYYFYMCCWGATSDIPGYNDLYRGVIYPEEQVGLYRKGDI
jgi:hypothetical protein